MKLGMILTISAIDALEIPVARDTALTVRGMPPCDSAVGAVWCAGRPAVGAAGPPLAAACWSALCLLEGRLGHVSSCLSESDSDAESEVE